MYGEEAQAVRHLEETQVAETASPKYGEFKLWR